MYEERRFRTTGLNFTNEDKRAKLPDWSRRLASCSTVGGLEEVSYRQLEAEYFLDLSKQTYS